MTVYHLGWGRATSLLFDKNLGLEKGTHVVRAFAGYAHFYRLRTFIACGRIKIETVAAGMQICAATLAFVRGSNLIHHLDF